MDYLNDVAIHEQLQALELSFKPSGLICLQDPKFKRAGIELWLKRDDLLHPIISGNKWRKLKFVINHALQLGCKHLVSMGGAYSNHLHALAYLGKALDIKTTGYIRGERPATFSPSLQDMQDWGMTLTFISRSEYRQLRLCQPPNAKPGSQPDEFWLPEGGALPLALHGVAEMVKEIDLPYDYICSACGTGTTLAGMIQAVNSPAKVLGFAALKDTGFIADEVSRLLDRSYQNWSINNDYHFGGFAKSTPELINFMADFRNKTGIALDKVYTGKMLFGIVDLIDKAYFKPGQRIIAVHTGGLQGNRDI
ncbi:MAG: pyridoxal-phosphate dependent enzyme [Methylococcaceae bacterium]|jgi:1-aminocyclopropane-1-carboxylate deaminase